MSPEIQHTLQAILEISFFRVIVLLYVHTAIFLAFIYQSCQYTLFLYSREGLEITRQEGHTHEYYNNPTSLHWQPPALVPHRTWPCIAHLASSVKLPLEAGPLTHHPRAIHPDWYEKSINEGNERTTNIRVMHLVSPVFTTFLKQGSSPAKPMHVSKIFNQNILDNDTKRGESYVFRNISTV